MTAPMPYRTDQSYGAYGGSGTSGKPEDDEDELHSTSQSQALSTRGPNTAPASTTAPTPAPTTPASNPSGAGVPASDSATGSVTPTSPAQPGITPPSGSGVLTPVYPNGPPSSGLMPSDPANVGTAVTPTSPAPLGLTPAQQAQYAFQNGGLMPNDPGYQSPQQWLATQGGGTSPTSPAPLGAQPFTTATTTPATTGLSPDIQTILNQGVTGQGAGSDVQSATNDAVLNALKNPNPYQNPAVQAQEAAGESALTEQGQAAQKQLDEMLASRGIGASSIAGGYYGDLAGQEANAQAQLQSNILTNQAQMQLAGQGQAISQGQNTANSNAANQQNWLSQLMGYGQQGFNNDVTTQELNQNQQNNYQNFLLQMLGLGYGGGTTG